VHQTCGQLTVLQNATAREMSQVADTDRKYQRGYSLDASIAQFLAAPSQYPNHTPKQNGQYQKDTALCLGAHRGPHAQSSGNNISLNDNGKQRVRLQENIPWRHDPDLKPLPQTHTTQNMPDTIPHMHTPHQNPRKHSSHLKQPCTSSSSNSS
jgi:hypothetical protein